MEHKVHAVLLHAFFENENGTFYFMSHDLTPTQFKEALYIYSNDQIIT